MDSYLETHGSVEGESRSAESSILLVRRNSPPATCVVAEECQQMLSRSPYTALRGLVCQFHEGALTLRGTVPTYHTKQMAYATLRNVPGVVRFVDCIEVAQADL